MNETERITDHAPIVRVPDAAKSMGVPPDLVSVRRVASTGAVKCRKCGRRLDEHDQSPSFEDEEGNPIEVR